MHPTIERILEQLQSMTVIYDQLLKETNDIFDSLLSMSAYTERIKYLREIYPNRQQIPRFLTVGSYTILDTGDRSGLDIAVWADDVTTTQTIGFDIFITLRKKIVELTHQYGKLQAEYTLDWSDIDKLQKLERLSAEITRKKALFNIYVNPQPQSLRNYLKHINDELVLFDNRFKISKGFAKSLNATFRRSKDDFSAALNTELRGAANILWSMDKQLNKFNINNHQEQEDEVKEYEEVEETKNENDFDYTNLIESNTNAPIGIYDPYYYYDNDVIENESEFLTTENDEPLSYYDYNYDEEE